MTEKPATGGNEAPAASLGRRVATAAAWAVGMRFADRFLGIASTVVLARLLVPADYGIVAMAMVVVAFVESLTSMGVDAALISKSNPDRADYDTAWTLSVGLGVILWALISVAAVPAAHYFGASEVQTVLFVLALAPLIGGFENIGVVDFRRNLRFDLDVVFTLSKRLSTFFVTVPLAFLWRNHWALVAGMVAGRAAGVALSYVMSAYRPRLGIERFGEMFHFSKWMLLSNGLVFFRARSADLLTGRLHGPAALGILTMSTELATIPSTELVMPINRALFPGYSQVSQDLGRMRTGFLKALGLVSLLSVPASVGLALVAAFAVPLFLGTSWLSAIPVVQVLALAGIATALQVNNWSIFLALRRPEVLVTISIVHITVLVGSLFYFVPQYGALGAGYSHLCAGAVSLPWSYVMIRRVIGLPIRSVIDVVWRPLVASGVMFVAVSAVSVDPVTQAAPASWLTARLLESIVLGAVVYGVSVLLCWMLAGRPASAERLALDFVLGRWRRYVQ